jgi:DNA helicase II / ATP-dependent DNA helicase PcrA
MTDFSPRPAQKRILRYRRGKMGISAVPGSGKTWTLSALAAQIIKTQPLDDDQEVLIVTLVNSAVDNFSNRISAFTQAMGLLPRLGYRVRTLHGLARDIVSERPDLVGLSDSFQIVDEQETTRILTDVVSGWLRVHPDALNDFFPPEMDEDRRDFARRDQLPRLAQDVALAFIKRAKDEQLTPETLTRQLREVPSRLPLAEMGVDIYRDYQRALAYRGGVDFDDLIRLAVEALERDPSFLERLQTRWPYILEDEAQDSSRLQEVILRMLTGNRGNWVRVGDPNQAIFETFTTASPHYLRDFLTERGVKSEQLSNSGRSTRSIMALANRLIEWTTGEHPIPDLREALTPPYIQPTPEGDPQPNPPDEETEIHLARKKFPPDAEIKVIADSLERWLPDNAEKTVAVLVPRNIRGFALAEELRRRKIEYTEMLRSSNATRLTAGALGNVLSYLSDPKSARKLATVFRVWRRADRDDENATARMDRVVELIKKCPHVETYLWPVPGEDWLGSFVWTDENQELYDLLADFRILARRWQDATILPVDQLILTLAQDLFRDPAELALAHKLALVLKRATLANTDWRLPELTDELATVAKNERRFIGFSSDDIGFDPEAHRGKPVITTMHKAKGLEWDRVYIMSVNNYDFPSAQPYDHYISEKWFVRDRLDLQAETLKQLDVLIHPDQYDWYEEGRATEQSRLDYAAERLRLFYVGITRAKKELVVTWNAGRTGDAQASIPLTALMAFREDEENEV